MRKSDPQSKVETLLPTNSYNFYGKYFLQADTSLHCEYQYFHYIYRYINKFTKGKFPLPKCGEIL